MIRAARHRDGFSLVELLIVISLVGILTALVIPNAGTSLHEQLQSAADIIAADIAYARSLAVAGSSKYRLTFDADANQYVLEHSGTNAVLNALPPSPFHRSIAGQTSQIVKLTDLPRMGPPVRLVGAFTGGGSPAAVDDLEFGPLGESTRSEETVIWLTAGRGTARRFLAVRVNPITGLTWVEGFQAETPAAVTATGTAVSN